ncbi:MAG: TolC family protein, partial [Acidobacteria bacterium]|nr:TolC family protein [Acidobacteriota bacterium]
FIAAMSLPLGASEVPENSTETLRREALVDEVLQRNPTIAEADAAIRAAAARLEVAGSLDDPRLSASIAPLTLDNSRIGATVELSQEIPWPGRLGAREDQARAMIAMQTADLERIQIELALRASVLYDRWYLIHRAVELNEHHRRLADQLKSSAESQYIAGTAAQQDPLQAEVRVTRLLRESIDLEAERRVIRAAINALLHRAPATPVPPPVDDLPPPELLSAEAVEQLEPMTEQPLLNLRRALIQEAEADVRLAELETRPDLMAMTQLNSMWMDSDERFMVGVGLRLPVRRSRIEASIRAARAELESRQAALASAEDEVAFEIQEALYVLVSHLETLSMYTDLLIPASRDQTDAAQTGFITGRNSFLAVLDAESNLQEVLVGYHQTLSAAWTAAARVRAAAGEVPFTTMEVDHE